MEVADWTGTTGGYAPIAADDVWSMVGCLVGNVVQVVFAVCFTEAYVPASEPCVISLR